MKNDDAKAGFPPDALQSGLRVRIKERRVDLRIDPELWVGVERTRYVSFDIFDTAVVRGVLNPKDLFSMVASVYAFRWGGLSFPFRAARVEAERMARDQVWDLFRYHEITLDEIYSYLQQAWGVDRETSERLKGIEIEAELRLCLRSEAIHELYLRCLEGGKRVLFISDMYLPQAVVEAILRNAGYSDWSAVYLSSSLRVTKSTGELYRLILKELGCDGRSILHIGDNVHSDVEMARQEGLSAHHYERCLDRAVSGKVMRTEALEPFSLDRVSSEESVYLSSVVRNMNRNRPGSDRGCRNYFWYEFGYNYAGIIFLGFTLWLLELSARDKVERLYFLSRDGYILKQAYDLLSPLYPDSPPSHYMYASRRAFNVPAILQLDEEAFQFLVSGTSRLCVNQFLSRLGLDPDACRSAVREGGFGDGSQVVTSGRDYAGLRRVFTLLAEQIRGQAERERDLLFEYLRQTGMLDLDRCGVVDIGWHGTLQSSLLRLTRDLGNNLAIKGYYLGTFPPAMSRARAGQNMAAYLCESGEPEALHDTIKLCVELFEFIHSAPHGSVLRFERRNGHIEPVLEDGLEEQGRWQQAQQLQEGAMAFIKDVAEVWASFPFLRISGELALKPIQRVLSRPTLEEAAMIGNLEHSEGFGDVYVRRYIAKPPGLSELLRAPGLFLERYRQSFWRIGYMKRMLDFLPNVRKGSGL